MIGSSRFGVFRRLITRSPDGIRYGDTYWDDIRVDASATRINPATSKPDFGAFPAGATYLKTFLFDGGARETVTFAVQIPHAYKLGTDLHPHVHWAATSAVADKTVIWDLNYSLALREGTFGAEVVRTGTTTGTTVANKHMTTELEAIDGSSITSVSAMLMCALSRRGDTDSYAADVALLEFDIHYEIDSPGSRAEYSK